MSIRQQMASACRETTADFVTTCGGEIRVACINGDDLTETLAEARAGCCQGCGCLSATASVVCRGGELYLVTRCSPEPGELALGRKTR